MQSYFPAEDHSQVSETRFSLEGWSETRSYNSPSMNSSETEYYSYYQIADFWIPVEPIHSFTENISSLLKIGICISAIWAGLVLVRMRYAFVAGLAAAAVLGVAALAFYQGFGDSLLASDLGGIHEFPGFFERSSTDTSSDVWGPMLGWWLTIIGCGIQCAGVGLVAIAQRRKKT